MQKLLFATALALALAAAGANEEDTCPAWGDFMPWSEHCLWLPLQNVRDGWTEACDVDIDFSKMPKLPQLENLPEKCGYCSFKTRCRKRHALPGCAPIESESMICDEHKDVCNMPPLPIAGLGCRYEFARLYMQQCTNRPDLPEWKRDAMRKFADMMPNFRCKEIDGECKCCCNPYEPSKDGSKCEQIEQPECTEFGDWTDFSEKCMWVPPKEMAKDIKDHCALEVSEKQAARAKKMLNKLTLPAGMEWPEKCGYCSFQVRCRKREFNKECFPLEVDKRACGDEQCEGCGAVCEFPQLAGSCNFTAQLRKMVEPGLKARAKKLSRGWKDGLLQIMSNMPHTRCVSKDDKCHCCCHPYMPNEDGTACVIKDICKNPSDVGLDINLNLPQEIGPSFFWF